ncbi:MAG: aryl-sulfate sulfotransferase, partial [Myxococcota bacterium]
IETGPLPAGLELPILVSADAALQDPSMPYLLTSVSSELYRDPVFIVILDRQGRIVWALQGPDEIAHLHVQLSADQRSLLVDHNSFWGTFDNGDTSTVVRMSLDGEPMETIATPGLHHPFLELPDGTVVWGAAEGRYSENLMERAPDGTVSTIWECRPFLVSLGIEDPETVCRSNTISWSPDRGTYLFSFFSTETVVEIDRASGTAIRWFGALPGSWGFETEEQIFWWQHGPHYTEDGTLLLSTRRGEAINETIVREYALDDAQQTLREVWSFGKGEGVYGENMGEARRLPSGNILHNYGSTPRIREATADGQVGWDVGWTTLRFIGRSTPLADLYSLY